MAWATYRSPSSGHSADSVGYVEDGHLYGLASVTRLVDLLGDDGSRLAAAAEQARRAPTEIIPLNQVKFRPPIPEPRSIRDFSCFLGHFRAGAKILGFAFNEKLLDLPIFYYTNNMNVVGDGDEVTMPGHSQQWDLELEVACVIGKPGIDIDPADAEQHIAGYCIMNDWSARDLLAEELGRGPAAAKGKDAGVGLGPLFVTPAEIEDRRKGLGFDLAMTVTVNGREYSRGNWSTLSWSFAEMIAYASRNTRLQTGEVLGSGTVEGGCLLELGAVHGRDVCPWLAPGDIVSVEIERLGRMTNTIKSGRKPFALEPRPAEG